MFKRKKCSGLIRERAILLRKQYTPQEQLLWRYLRANRLGCKFRRQFPIDNKYIVDFVCLEKKLIIEIDGSQHADNQQDLQRTAYLTKQGFSLLRFWNCDIDNQLQACLDKIYSLIFPSPSP